MLHRRLSTVSALLLLLALSIALVGSHPASAQADPNCPSGDDSDNNLNCPDNPPPPSGDLENYQGFGGNDRLTVGDSAYFRSVFGDGDLGAPGGDDYLNISGKITGSIAGDHALTGGDDILVVEAFLVGDVEYIVGQISGDSVQTDAGDDMLRIGGRVSVLAGDYVASGIGGNDLIIYEGTGAETIHGDWIGNSSFLNAPEIAGIGGDDVIFNQGTSLAIMGDTALDGGDDYIANTGYAGFVYGDDVSRIAGNDTIVNGWYAEIETICGDYVGQEYGLAAGYQAGEDLIINFGTVGDIYGDCVSDGAGGYSGEGADDVIVNYGTVEGIIAAEGGNDTVILYAGDSLGDPTEVTTDGGTGNDTLIFWQPDLEQPEIDALLAQNPASGSVTIDNHTFTWTNFETIEVQIFCDEPTDGPDEILCLWGDVLPQPPGYGGELRGLGGDDMFWTLIGTDFIDGGAGSDQIFVLGGGPFEPIDDLPALSVSSFGSSGTLYGGDGDDIITTYGAAGEIFGDDEGVGSDIISNYSVAGAIYGDFSDAEIGGDDVITNYLGAHAHGLYGDAFTETGGDDIIRNFGEVDDGIEGDAFDVIFGGDDTIVNGYTGSTMFIIGDSSWVGGNDTITNRGEVFFMIAGDGTGYPDYGPEPSIPAASGNDTIINTGIVGSIFGDFTLGTPGEDIIINSGVVDGDIYGDYVENNPSAGADDQIINSGTVGGIISADGGDDVVTLQDGANGGPDNLLLIDGGEGEDTLIFDFDVLEPAVIDALEAADPAGGSIVIGSQTFQWTNFEIVTYSGAPGCPLGDDDDNVLVCEVSPPTLDNPTTEVYGYGGNDTITIEAGVELDGAWGDYPYNPDNEPPVAEAFAISGLNTTVTVGGNDTITNHGYLSSVGMVGDGTLEGGDDVLINTGVIEGFFGISGDGTYGDGGDDEIINSGESLRLVGDFLLVAAVGGDDIITNTEDGVTEEILGDSIEADGSVPDAWLGGQGGNDTITNAGEANIISGDFAFNGGDDEITNSGQAVLILGDGVHSIAGSDTIINSGTAGGIVGDYIEGLPGVPREYGEDVIINTGVVTGDIEGDGVEVAGPQPTGEGAADEIINSGTVSGTIHGNGGDDVVTLQDGANGGADNLLLIDGGEGEDTLIFAFATLDQSVLHELGHADPAGGSVTIDGQTFEWVNFEYLTYTAPGCPDGTPLDDVIVCSITPVSGELFAFAGNDEVTITGSANVDLLSLGLGNDEALIEVTAIGYIVGDGDFPIVCCPVGFDGGDDTIINYADFDWITGDSLVEGDGGNDTIVNYGDGGRIWGDTVEDGDGGDDIITNYGTMDRIEGDFVLGLGAGGDDIITNAAGGVITYTLWGDGLYGTGPAGYTSGPGGDDTIINAGVVGDFIAGDIAFIGGNDTITNSGTVGEIYGDYVQDTAGEDVITNSGTVTGSIYGDFMPVDVYAEIPIPSGEGADDQITNSGTVGGAIYAEGGDDVVTLQDGANGGADNLLLIDGGSGTDTLVFDFLSLPPATISALQSANPASGSIVIGTQTFQWVNFEAIEVENSTPPTLTLSAPVGTITAPYGNPAFTWTDIPGVSYYTVVVSNSAGTQVINEVVADAGYCDGATCQIDFTTLRESYRLVNGAYIWAARPYFSATGFGAWSVPAAFTLNAVVPGLPTLGTVANTNTLTPMFNWTLEGTAQNATYLNIYVAPASNPAAAALNGWYTRAQVCGSVSGTTCQLVSPVTLVDNTAYVLYARSYGPGGLSTGGVGGYAGPVSFTIDAPTPALPANVEAVAAQGIPTITWNDDPAATHFELVIHQPGVGTPHQQWYERALICDTSACAVTPNVTLVNGSYQIYIRAYGPGGFSTGGVGGYAGPISLVLTFSAPLPPLNLIANNADTGRPTLSFTASPGTTWHEVLVTGGGIVRYQGWTQAAALGCAETMICALALAVDLPNGTYEFYARSYGPGGLSGYTAATSFVVAAPIMTAPVLTAPTGTTTDNTPTFTWNHVTGATYYHVWVGTSPALTLISDAWYAAAGLGCEDTICELIIPGVTLPNGAYVWVAQAYSPAGIGPWSAVAEFNINVPAPAAPALVNPAADAVIHTTNRPTFTWSVPEHTAYIYLEIKNGLGTVVFGQWLQAGVSPCAGGQCIYQIPTPIAFGSYTWRTAAWSQGGYSPWSESRTFLSLSINLVPMVVDAGDALIVQAGSWTESQAELALGQSVLVSSAGAADSLTLSFTGTAIDVVYAAGPAYGTFVIEIDGQPVRAVNAYAAQMVYGQIAAVSGLSEGTHTLRIIALGGAPVAVDALLVSGQAVETVSTPVPTATSTPVLTQTPAATEVMPTATPEVTPPPTDAPAGTPTPAPVEATPEATVAGN